jgi:hypothetical protein
MSISQGHHEAFETMLIVVKNRNINEDMIADDVRGWCRAAGDEGVLEIDYQASVREEVQRFDRPKLIKQYDRAMNSNKLRSERPKRESVEMDR